MKKIKNTESSQVLPFGKDLGWAIQGYQGSFHEEAARHYLGKKITVIPCANFRELIRVTETDKKTAGAVMAIENSIAGSILPNYNLLQKSKLKITGEIFLQIRQNLLVNQGVTMKAIREVHSHPMAIQQCLAFLERHKWKLIETEDTALSAKQLHQHNSKHVAAIASSLAAKLFKLKIIAKDIHELKNNYTRFLILQRGDLAKSIINADKASVNFRTDHSKGSLARVLSAIADGGINLSKLQSFPIPGSDFKYSFHADMEFDTRKQFDEVIEKINPLTTGLTIYGIYKKGLWK